MVTSKKKMQEMQKNLNQTEMAEFESILPIVNQIIMQATTARLMVLRDTDARP